MNDKEFQEFVVQHLSKLTEGQEKLRQDIAKIEYEHGDKLGALLDGYKLLHEKLDDHTERLERIESKIETHDIQIQVLDKTKSNRRKAK